MFFFVVVVVFFVIGFIFDYFFYDLFDIVDIDEDIFGFQVGVNYVIFVVQIVEVKQNLFGDLFDERYGNVVVVLFFDEIEEVFVEDFEDYVNVGVIWFFVFK